MKDELARAILTVSIVLLAICWYLWTLLKSKRGIAPLPPGPRGLPIVGYLPFMGTEWHLLFRDLAHVYGPIFKVWLGSKLCVVLSSPSLVKEVVRDQDTTFANRDVPAAAFIFAYGGHDVAWTPYGPLWRNLRKILVRDMQSKASLDGCYSLRRQEVRRTVRDVYTKIGKPVGVFDLAFLTEINVLMSLLWGGTPDGQKSCNAAEFQEVASEIVELFGAPNVSDFFPMLARFDLQGVQGHMKRLMHWVDNFLDPIIDQRMNAYTAKGVGGFQNDERKDYLQILLELREHDEVAASLTKTEIKAMFMDTLLGGADTTSITVEWVMAEMMQHRKIMERVQEELANVVGLNDIVEESHLPKLAYLDAVVKETLRLHPAGPLLVPRSPSKSSTVGGYTIPQGARVFVNAWEMQRDPQAWDNPTEFKPERFLNDTSKGDYSGNNFHYLPFGSGRRICAGIHLAERMVNHIVASLLHSFVWHLPEGEELDLSDKFGMVLKKRTPLVAIPTKRLSNLELYE